ncbi:hypothetical protein D1872_271530 [compost metagenome]
MRLFIVTARKNARPVDRQAEDLEPKLCKQGDVLSEPMVEIDAVTLRISFGAVMSHRFLHLRARYVHQFPQVGVILFRKIRNHVRRREAFAARVESPFCLIGGNGAAPQKSFRKTLSFVHLGSLPLLRFWLPILLRQQRCLPVSQEVLDCNRLYSSQPWPL